MVTATVEIRSQNNFRETEWSQTIKAETMRGARRKATNWIRREDFDTTCSVEKRTITHVYDVWYLVDF